jgi:hypothetical protein
MGRYLELVRSASHESLTGSMRIKGERSELSPPYFAYFANSQTPPLKKESNIEESASSKLLNDFKPSTPTIQSEDKGACELSELSELGSYKAALAALVAKRPDGVLNPRYIQAIADADIFQPTWGERAAALGWTADDLFGLDPVAPMARYDVMGLLWLTQGCPIVALTERSATIKMPTGNYLVFYRRGVHQSWNEAPKLILKAATTKGPLPDDGR